MNGSWDLLGEILRDAHAQRLRLSPNISTPQIDLLIGKAMANGAIAAKICGAGGGGCIAFYCEDGRKDSVETALASEQGVEVLNWNIAPSGLQIRTEAHA
jgi:D-glycero-alpha-D-manno-heptose-7-phosphate kinase